jgi:hypothetical protein
VSLSCNTLALLLVLPLAGCSWTVKNSAQVDDPVAIYLTDYGRHTSIIMPVSDSMMVEYAFGDWDWFAANQNDSFSGVRALTFSRGSTLGRRFYVKTDDLNELMRLSDAQRVARLTAPSPRVKKLSDRLDRAYMKHIDTWRFNELTHLDHVRSDRHYWGLDNCNQLTATWLRELGLKVSGISVFSNFKAPEATVVKSLPAGPAPKDDPAQKDGSPPGTRPAPATQPAMRASGRNLPPQRRSIAAR